MNKTALTTNAVTAILAALILLDVIHLTEKQTAGIGLAITATLTMLHAWFDKTIPFGPTDS